MHRFREPVSGFTHLAGALLAAAGLAWLILLTRADPAKLISMIVYGASLVLLYTASTVMHLTKGSERLVLWLNRIDHAAIYVLIAGSYTPIAAYALTGAWRWGLLAVVWALALVGIVYKLFFLQRGGHLSTLFYIGMGWLGVIVVPQITHVFPMEAIALLLAGGLIYSAGALIFALRKPNFHPHFGFHELWHLFVLAGSALHFVVVLRYVA
jgi:hemolysin III